jgi:hypothetical protein
MQRCLLLASPAGAVFLELSSKKLVHCRTNFYSCRKMVLLHIKKADDLQMLVPVSTFHHISASNAYSQVEVPAASPLSEAIPNIATLWNTMLKMRKLADCCIDLATYFPFCLAFPQSCNYDDIGSSLSRFCHRYGEAKPPAEQGIDEYVCDPVYTERT